MSKVFTIMVVLAVISSSCSKKEEPADSGTTGNFTSVAVANMASVSSGYAPASLGSASQSSLRTMNENPCQGTNGLIDCQPNLLKLYLGISKQMFESVSDMVTQIGSGLGQLPDGASGQVTTEDGQIIIYSKASAEQWSFEMRTAAGVPLAYVSIVGGVYTLEMDSAASGEQGATAKFSSILSFTDSDTWTMTSTIVGMACDANDARAPQNFRIVMNREGALWTGKSMMYLPRWANVGSVNCSSTSDDDKDANIYSDFVADETAARMAVYALKRTRGANEISSHPLSQICTEFSPLCGGGSTLGSETPSNYPNPVCIPASTGAGSWNNDCGGVSTTIQSASFGPSTDWLAPSSFHGLTISVGP